LHHIVIIFQGVDQNRYFGLQLASLKN